MIVALLLGMGVLIGVLLSALVSALETGSYSLNRVRLRVRQEQNAPAARRLGAIMNRQEDLVITALMGNALADYIGSVSLTALLMRMGGADYQAELYATLILTPLLLVFGGILPKEAMRRRADELMYPLAGVVTTCVTLARATGLVALLRGLSRAFLRWIDPRAGSEDALMPRQSLVRMLQEGAAHGQLSGFQRTMIDRIVNLAHVRVAQVMIPRQRCALAPADLARDDFLRIARMAHFSRIPVWKGEARNVVGVVNVYDVITDAAQRPVVEHARPPLTLAANEPVPDALLKLQKARQAMAIVVDNNRNCVGLLTIKDLVEEIIGELEVW